MIRELTSPLYLDPRFRGGINESWRVAQPCYASLESLNQRVFSGFGGSETGSKKSRHSFFESSPS